MGSFSTATIVLYNLKFVILNLVVIPFVHDEANQMMKKNFRMTKNWKNPSASPMQWLFHSPHTSIWDSIFPIYEKKKLWFCKKFGIYLFTTMQLYCSALECRHVSFSF